ncbi:hypothetical protein C6P46_004709 [Rhodotorula mucilaginosa]|uniref:Heat shock factor binding protein 1 n=1 Tax=Rhodotorula mucilaginosa TaxID=5537 RepID=A0A9P6VZD3_RHOMI|nr:hypothetical protein C6P46_004709 [Rhodotorula mucilaginosa]
MVFSQPLVPSPTLSSSAKTPPLGSSSSSSSTPQQQQPASPATSKASYSTATAQPATVGLGVLGAPGPDEEELADASKAQVTSPLELTQFVDTLLNDLEARFDSLSSDVLSRLNSLSTRVDSLETSLADLMSGSTLPPPPPQPPASTNAASSTS